MHVDIKNLGTITTGSFHTNDLTIIFGKNNSGKTYISYATYILIKKIKTELLKETTIVKEINACKKGGNYKAYELSINKIIDTIASEKFKKTTTDLLSSGFCVSNNFFKDTEISINTEKLKKEAISKKIEITVNHLLGEHIAFITKNESSDILNVIITNTSLFNDEDDSELTGHAPKNENTLIDNHFHYQIAMEIINESIVFDIKNPFIITSERTGIELFYPELDNNRSNIAEEMAYSTSKQNVRKKDFIELFEKNVSKYSLPIADNIRSIRNGSRKRSNGDLVNHDNYPLINKTLKKITQGDFLRTELGDTIFLINGSKQEIPLQVASSSIKSMSLFDMYINKLSVSDGALIIDEPELNLHPDNQILMAELIVRLVNSGIKVIMTTHSDYIIREINNRIKLNKISNKKKEELKKYIENDIDVISHNRINAFCITENKTIKEIKITENGFQSVIFDDVIISSSEREDDINYITESF